MSLYWQAQVIRNDQPRHAAFTVQAFDLKEQALAKILRADSGRVHRLNHFQRGLDVLELVLAHDGDFFKRSRKIAVLVQVSDHRLGSPANFVGHDADAQLLAQVVAERYWCGKERFERRLFY